MYNNSIIFIEILLTNAKNHARLLSIIYFLRMFQIV